MDLQQIFVATFWAGIFAASLAVVLTAPPQNLLISFICGAAGRFTCDMSVALGLPRSAAVAIAALVVILAAVSLQRSMDVSPAIVISAVVPLGAAVTMLNAMWHLLTLASLQGDALKKALEVLSVDFAQVCITSFAIVAGLGFGLVIVRLIRREEAWEQA